MREARHACLLRRWIDAQNAAATHSGCRPQAPRRRRRSARRRRSRACRADGGAGPTGASPAPRARSRAAGPASGPWSCSWTPAPASTTRRATSGWSRPNGTATIGTPAAIAFCTMPMPLWQTTAAARSSTGACGDEALDAHVRRACGSSAAPYASASVSDHPHGLVAQRLDRATRASASSAWYSVEARDQHPRVARLVAATPAPRRAGPTAGRPRSARARAVSARGYSSGSPVSTSSRSGASRCSIGVRSAAQAGVGAQRVQPRQHRASRTGACHDSDEHAVAQRARAGPRAGAQPEPVGRDALAGERQQRRQDDRPRAARRPAPRPRRRRRSCRRASTSGVDLGDRALEVGALVAARARAGRRSPRRRLVDVPLGLVVVDLRPRRSRGRSAGRSSPASRATPSSRSPMRRCTSCPRSPSSSRPGTSGNRCPAAGEV